MTTIAWDGRVMAADRMSEFCGMRMAVTKIHRLGDGRLWGAAGNEATSILMRHWLEHGGERPPEQADRDRSVHGLEVRLDGSLWLHTPEGSFPVEDAFAAVGSGTPYAMAAMHLGQDATAAVAVAMRFDPRSGMGVDALALAGPHGAG